MSRQCFYCLTSLCTACHVGDQYLVVLFIFVYYQTEKTFAKDLDKAYEAMAKEIKKMTDVQDYVSATADIWSVNNKSLMGVTLHWIDADAGLI